MRRVVQTAPLDVSELSPEARAAYERARRTAFESVDPRHEEVSLTLGIPPWRTFLRVTLPLALPGLAAGAVLAFARSLGEFGATAVLAGNIEGETRTWRMTGGWDGPMRSKQHSPRFCGPSSRNRFRAASHRR